MVNNEAKAADAEMDRRGFSEGIDPVVAEAAELKRDGSELAGDRLETIILSTTGFGEAADYFVAEAGKPDQKEGQYNSLTGPNKGLNNAYEGRFTVQNGFLAYIPKGSDVYCLMAGTPENIRAVASMGYQESPQEVGVLSFKGDEQLRARVGSGAEATFLNAQIELLKAQAKHGRTRVYLNKAQETGDETQIKPLEDEYAAEIKEIEQARALVERVAGERPDLVRKFS